MIFVTLGSQKFQFNRLLKQIDMLVENSLINEPIFAQTGTSDYQPKNYKFKDFIDRDEFSSIMEHGDIVITHGGTGAIIGAVKKNKKVIAVPRLVEYGEHVDNHQIQLIKQFEEMHLIYTCLDLNELGKAIEEITNMTFHSYQSNTNRIVDSIEDFIARI